MSRYLIIGAICGLAWSAALRGWMAELTISMPNTQSQVTWLTLVLVLLPGVAVGTTLGYSAYLRTVGRGGSRWLIFSPILFASALLDPRIFISLITDGLGAGSLLTIATALSLGYVLTRPHWSISRALTAMLCAVGLLIVFGIGEMAAPLGTPRGMWVGLFGVALVMLLGIASVLPYRPLRRSLGARWWIALGSLAGFAWAAGLRSFMAQVAIKDGSSITWSGTFLWILAPGLVTGGLLGWAAYLRRHGGPRLSHWLASSPFLFAALLVPPLLTLDFEEFFAAAIGGGTIGVPAAALAGAYALAGRRTWLRILSSLFPLSSIPIWVLTASQIGGDQLGLDTARGLWVALYYWSLLGVIALACAIPMRITPKGVHHGASDQPPVPGLASPRNTRHAH
ncbi:hypothetical protein [Arthrobacter flavus]|uniref:Tellurite resistance protein TehA n=1 Tax=Arthrobacter flavus TaxID=95172 RepID=A0ABW4Q1J7_9MICC